MVKIGLRLFFNFDLFYFLNLHYKTIVNIFVTVLFVVSASTTGVLAGDQPAAVVTHAARAPHVGVRLHDDGT